MTETDDDGSMRTTRSSDDHHARLRSELHERAEAVVHAASNSYAHELALGRLMYVIGEIDRTSTGIHAALRAHTLVRLFALRAEKEETILIPALERAGVDVPELLDGVVMQMATEHDSRFTYF